jgi:hypothetical protein
MVMTRAYPRIMVIQNKSLIVLVVLVSFSTKFEHKLVLNLISLPISLNKISIMSLDRLSWVS